MLTIREFSEETDDDYKAGIALWNANWPLYLENVEEWKAWHASRNPTYFYERLIGELDGEVVCFAQWGEEGWSDYAGKHFWKLELHPDVDYETVGTQIYDHIMAKIIARSGTKVGYHTLSDKVERIAFVKSRGYELVQTMPTTWLDVTTFDAAPFQPAVDKARAAGIKIYSCAQLKAQDPQWKRKLYDLRWELIQDMPSPDTPKQEEFEIFSKRLDDPISAPLDTQYTAVDTTSATATDLGEYVAISNLEYNRVNKTIGHTGLTGVARLHRRKGIATAIKVHAISQAQADGIKQIETGNDENNPMLDLNIRLGFKPGDAWVTYDLVIA